MSAEVRLGMVRLTDAAPLVQASVAGLFAAEGVAVALSVEPSWANIADKLAWGLLDGAVMLPPLAIAMTLGLRDPPTRLVIASGISRNGNAVTLSTRLAGLRPQLRWGVVHAHSTHDLLLRLFLERAGLDPAAAFAVLPPAEMPQALAEGRIDGFCAGAPWGAVAAEQGAGRTIAISGEIAPGHPEKCLAVRADWAATHPAALQAIQRALALAAAYCQDPASTSGLAALLAAPEWVGVPARLIALSLPGGPGAEADRSRFNTAFSPADADWLVAQMGRWRPLPDRAAGQVTHMVQSLLST